MFSGAADMIKDLAKQVHELYKEFVTTSTKFESLRIYTKEAIDEFKRLLERQSEKIDRIERDRTKAEAELLTRINALEQRLTFLSERALHLVAKEAVTEAAKSRFEAEPREIDRTDILKQLEKGGQP